MLKFTKNEKYKSMAFYATMTLVVSALIILLIINFNLIFGYIKRFFSILSPFIWGFVFAYLVNPVCTFFETKVFRMKKAKRDMRVFKRVISIVLSYILIIAVISVLVYSVLPRTMGDFEELGVHLNMYVSGIQKFADNIVSKYSSSFLGEHYTSFSELLTSHGIDFSLSDLFTKVYNSIESNFNELLSFGSSILGHIFNMLIGLFLSFYFLFSKEKIGAQAKKLLSAVTTRRTYLNTVRLCRYTHKTFGGFIVGKIIDSIIIGLITFIFLWIFGIPYAPMISVFIGITNILPTFGPIIGGAAGAILILLVQPSKLLIFIIIVLLIQQLDGNVIGPKILGDTIGLNAMWVIISIVAAGGLFGFLGLLVGVPLTAVIYALVKQWTEKRLRMKKMPVRTSFYETDPPLDTEIYNGRIFIGKDTPLPEIEYIDTFDDEDTKPKVKTTVWKKLKRRIKNKKNRPQK